MLKYPNARLLIHNLVAEKKLSGAEALEAGACQYGLVSAHDLQNHDGQCSTSDGDSMCSCTRSAKFVLKKHLEKNAQTSAASYRMIWRLVKERIEKSHTIETKETTAEGARCTMCALHAPAVFDYLLQEIHRHL